MAGHEMSHRELIAELVEALEKLVPGYALWVAPLWGSSDRSDPQLAQARAVLDKAKAIEDCIPIEDAYEAAMDHGH